MYICIHIAHTHTHMGVGQPRTQNFGYSAYPARVRGTPSIFPMNLGYKCMTMNIWHLCGFWGFELEFLYVR